MKDSHYQQRLTWTWSEDDELWYDADSSMVSEEVVHHHFLANDLHEISVLAFL